MYEIDLKWLVLYVNIKGIYTNHYTMYTLQESMISCGSIVSDMVWSREREKEIKTWLVLLHLSYNVPLDSYYYSCDLHNNHI